MLNELVGTVTNDEKEDILKLFERKNGLQEMLIMVDNPNGSQHQKDTIYEKVIADVSATSSKMRQWWDQKAKKYKWKSAENGSWSIDFETNEIYLINK